MEYKPLRPHPFEDGQTKIIQGGTAVESGNNIAEYVAEHQGAIGCITSTGRELEITVGFIENAFEKLEIIRKEKKFEPIVFLNQMACDNREEERITASVATGHITAVVEGAGYSRVGAEICKKEGVHYAPIIKSPDQVLRLLKFNQGYVSFFVYEAKEAGGHLGDINSSLYDNDYAILNAIIAEASLYGVPVIAAGAITPERVPQLFAKCPGLYGIQIATGLQTAKNNSIPEEARELYLKAQDTFIFRSPAGYDARAIKTKMFDYVDKGVLTPEFFGTSCNNCISHCDFRTLGEKFCIRGALQNLGEMGVLFSGHAIWRWNDPNITIGDIINEYRSVMPSEVRVISELGGLSLNEIIERNIGLFTKKKKDDNG